MQSFYSITYFASFIIISELWFYSYTDGERTMLLSYFERAYFYCDIHSVVRQRVLKTVEKFSKDPEHILNHFYCYCYKRGRQSFISAKSKTTRFCDSFTPTSIRFLNLSAK